MRVLKFLSLGFCLLGAVAFDFKDNDLVGIWQMSVRSGYFEKINYTPRTRSYFIFEKKGNLKFIQNNRDCGDGNPKNKQEGSWKQINDSTLALTYHSCAGDVYIHWEMDKKNKEKIRFRPTSFAGDYE